MRNLNPSAAHFSYPTCETTRHSPRGQLLHLNDATKKGVPEYILYLLLCDSNLNVSINKIICLKICTYPNHKNLKFSFLYCISTKKKYKLKHSLKFDLSLII